MSEFHIETKDTDEKQDEKRVGLDDAVEKLLAAAHLMNFDDRIRKLERLLRTVETRDCAAVQLSEQGAGVRSDEINEMAVQRFLFAEGFRIGDRGNGERHITAAE